jgi:hypothetical protein
MKIIKISNCRECQYIEYINSTGKSGSYNYCRYRYKLTGEIKKIENKEMIANWCNLDDYIPSDENLKEWDMRLKIMQKLINEASDKNNAV